MEKQFEFKSKNLIVIRPFNLDKFYRGIEQQKQENDKGWDISRVPSQCYLQCGHCSVCKNAETVF